MEVSDHLPGFLGRFGVLEQFHMFIPDDTFVGQELEIDDALPIFPRIQNDWDLLHPARLAERQRGKQFVQGSKPTRETDQRFGSQQKVHFANGKNN